MRTRQSRQDMVSLLGSDNRSEDWPRFPFLPLVRGDEPEVGLIVDGHGAVVFMGNLVDAELHQMFADGDDAESLNRWLAGRDVERYVDVEAVLDGGWVID